jgi:hypothetical protein
MRRRIAAVLGVLSVLGACTGSDAPLPPPSGSTIATDDASIGPVRADQPKWRPDGANWAITLSWEPPEGVELDHYVVLRDGRTLTEDVTEPSFVDEDATPAARYRYSVLGVDTEGTRTEPGSVSIRTKKLSLVDARLQGRFVVRLDRGAFSGLQGTPRDIPGLGLQFEPACNAGPCPVTLAIRGSGRYGPLRRNGASYSGTVRGPFTIRSCQGGTVDATLVVGVRIRTAGAVGGQWRATAIQGSIQESAAPAGCLTGRISWTFKGRSS